MPTNVFFNHAVNTEQMLYEDIVVESLRMFGHETYYLPREIVEEDTILGEDVQSKFGDAYSVEMYLENTDGFEGDGDLMSKFGVQVRDPSNIRYIPKNMGTIHFSRFKPYNIIETQRGRFNLLPYEWFNV